MKPINFKVPKTVYDELIYLATVEFDGIPLSSLIRARFARVAVIYEETKDVQKVLPQLPFGELKSSDFQFQETCIPTLLTKAWVGIPKEGKWKELSDFVEFVWLTIAMKEYQDAMKIITLSLQIRLKVERGITPISI